MIMTVTGPIEPEALGFCQCHEHLLISKGRSYEQNPVLWMEDIEKSTREVLAFKQAGGDAIIDAQPGGCNRMEQGLKRISRDTGVSIISSTGFHKMMFYSDDHWIHHADKTMLYHFFLDELCTGMYEGIDIGLTSVQGSCRAGIVKTALDLEGLNGVYRRLFDGAVRAAMETKVPMMIHVEQGSDPRMLLEYLLNQGMKAEKLMFCHMDRSVEGWNYYEEILGKGAFLDFDTIGRFKYHGDEEEINLIKGLMSRGYEDRLLLSLDTTRERLRAYNEDGIGLDYLLKQFLPALQSAGVTENQIHKISRQNCCQIFR